jgi:hypothetical protein
MGICDGSEVDRKLRGRQLKVCDPSALRVAATNCI